MPISPIGEDWNTVTVLLEHHDGTVAGQLIPSRGPLHPVAGEFFPGGAAVLNVGELPINHTVPCPMYGIFIEAIEHQNSRPAALVGRVQGRCPNTLAGAVRLDRD